MSQLVQAGFETLVEAGYAPEIAYFECLHELKFIVDLMHESGLAGMRRLISETALWGELKVGPTIIDSHVKKKMAAALRRIRSGRFSRELLNETRGGRQNIERMRRTADARLIEQIGNRLRNRMAWKKGRQEKNIPEPACSRFRHFANFVAMPSPLVVGDPRITDHQHRDRGRRNSAEPFDRLRNSRSGRLYIVNDPPRLLDYLILSLRDVFIVAVSECGDAERKAQHGSNAQQAGKPEGCFHIPILRLASVLCNLNFAPKSDQTGHCSQRKCSSRN